MYQKSDNPEISSYFRFFVSFSLYTFLFLYTFIFFHLRFSDILSSFLFSFFLSLQIKTNLAVNRRKFLQSARTDIAKIVPHLPCMPRDRWHTSFENEISLPDEPSLPLFIVEGHLVSLWISWRSSSPETNRPTSSFRSNGFLFHGKKDGKNACFRSTWIFKQRYTTWIEELKRRKFSRECNAYFATV